MGVGWKWLLKDSKTLIFIVGSTIVLGSVPWGGPGPPEIWLCGETTGLAAVSAVLSAPMLGSGRGAWFMDGQKENTVLYIWLCSAVLSGPKKTNTPSRDEWCETVKANRTCLAALDFNFSTEKQSYKESFVVQQHWAKVGSL